MYGKTSMESWPSVSVQPIVFQWRTDTTDFSLDLYKKVLAQQWLESAQDEDANSITSLKPYRGVVLQRADGGYVAHPPNLHEDVVKAVLRLNVPVAFTMSSETTAALIRQTDPNQALIGNPRSGNPVLPIIDSVESLAGGLRQVARDNFICLCWKEQFVLVWGDNVSNSDVLMSYGITDYSTGRRDSCSRE